MFLTSIRYSQINTTKIDSNQIDSLTNTIERLALAWNPEDEPWNFITFEIKELELTVRYGQQSIHPFLAEYNRKIQFETKVSKTDTLDMTLNWGGRTWIEFNYDKDKNLIVMEDRFGRYFFNFNTLTYSEKLEDFEKYTNKDYIGRINGKDGPLKFEIIE